MKSEPREEYVTTKPAIVDAKLRMVAGVAGSEGGGLMRCFPPTPRAMTKVTSTGIQATRSNLQRNLISALHVLSANVPVENLVSAERYLHAKLSLQFPRSKGEN